MRRLFPNEGFSRLVPCVSLPSLILLATAAQIATGVLSVGAWSWSGDVAWVQGYFRHQLALFLLATPAVELWLCVRSWRMFSPGDPLRPAWLLLACAAGFHAAEMACSEALGVQSHLNPWLTNNAALSQMIFNNLRWLGATMGGPMRWALSACGFFLVLRVYRRAGLLRKLTQSDQMLIVGIALYTLLEAGSVYVATASGAQFTLHEKIAWLNDPLLLVLLLEAILIRRAVLATGWGLVAQCWGMFVAAIALTCAGNLCLWARTHGYLPGAAQAITWNLWFLSGVACALGPAYQVEAVRRIQRGLRLITLRRAEPARLRAAG
jgi:hypothetical protein